MDVSKDQTDERTSAIWREWFVTLANNADAALAAAIAYERLDEEARTRWLMALELEAPTISVPLIAAYGPLLAVELDAQRLQRIQRVLEFHGQQSTRVSSEGACVAWATPSAAVRQVVISSPTYLDFHQVVRCRLEVGQRFLEVRREPFVHRSQAPRHGDQTPDGTLEPEPLRSAVDVLARTIVAHQRNVGSVPESLRSLAHLFGASDSG